MNLENASCPYCRGIGLVRNRTLPRPADHPANGHEPPINGHSGCGCTYDICTQPHIIVETPITIADGTKSAVVTYLDPVQVDAMGWLIESRTK